MTMSRPVTCVLVTIWYFIMILCAAEVVYVICFYIGYISVSHQPKNGLDRGSKANVTFHINRDINRLSMTMYGSDNNVHVTRNWEKLVYNDPVLTDWKSCASSNQSILYKTGTKSSFEVGDVVKVDIIVKDHYGRRKVTGGDMVRIWVKEKGNDACAAGYVMDNDDGSYQGVVKLLWVGNVTIVARVATPRELVRLLFHRASTGTSREQMVGKFKHGNISKISNCSPMEETSSRYWKTCNLTHKNSDLPWYCEKPHELSCADWAENTYDVVKSDFTTQEQHMFESLLNHENMKSLVHLIVKDTSIIDNSHADVPYLEACNTLPVYHTWKSRPPVGFMYKGRWNSTQCRSTFDGSRKAYTRCLKGRKLWLFGDSTTRQFFSYLKEFLELELKSEKWKDIKWQKPLLISNADETISVFWGLHALPYKTNVKNDSKLVTKGTHLYIDRIPADSNDIVVVHHYLHYNTYHPDVVRNHIRKTAESVKSLKERAPDVKVVVKGPHAYINESLGIRYDFWGVIYDTIFKEEFINLVHDVVYLDLWDITVATESTDRHPNRQVLQATINHMMSFACP